MKDKLFLEIESINSISGLETLLLNRYFVIIMLKSLSIFVQMH